MAVLLPHLQGRRHFGIPESAFAFLFAFDFRSYVDAQERAAVAYRDRERWTRMSILNTAASGKFSTDRTMAEYNAEIWKLTPGGAGPVIS